LGSFNVEPCEVFGRDEAVPRLKILRRPTGDVSTVETQNLASLRFLEKNLILKYA